MKQTELGRQNLFDKIHRCRQLREQNHMRQQYDQRVSLYIRISTSNVLVLSVAFFMVQVHNAQK